MKKHAPATLRNREAIADVLARELPDGGTVLEVASGSGEHAVYFADAFPKLTWQPSDPSPEALESIAAYRSEYEGENLLAPVHLDANAPADWPVERADAMLCVNMIHISPWSATLGLLAGAAGVLGKGAPLILYGPYFEAGVEPAPSNLAFDAGLRERNSEWGIRDIADIDKAAKDHGFTRANRQEMPANNLMLIYRKG